MKMVLVSKCFLDIEQYVEFKMSVLISPSKSLISSRWVTHSFRSIDASFIICIDLKRGFLLSCPVCLNLNRF